MSDSLWRELEAVDRRQGPEINPAQVGPCDVCRLPMNFPLRVDAIDYAACLRCMTYRTLGHHFFVGPLWRQPQTDEDRYEAMTVLAACIDLDESTNSPGDQMKNPTRTTAPDPLLRDPWPNTKPGDDSDPTGPPKRWYLLNPDDRCRLGRVVELSVREARDGSGLSPSLILRAHFTRAEELGENRERAATVLSRGFFITDEDEKAKWRSLAFTLAQEPRFRGLLESAVQRLSIGINRIESLREQLARLEAARGVGR